eukprot:GHVS01019492.1.p1 GENE.GHVS01019492.1~~GHVS01019492.1.p1  ORF type:complete len:672 (+),score=128.47 GHVS01019492.1:64-2016(+)
MSSPPPASTVPTEDGSAEEPLGAAAAKRAAKKAEKDALKAAKAAEKEAQQLAVQRQTHKEVTDLFKDFWGTIPTGFFHSCYYVDEAPTETAKVQRFRREWCELQDLEEGFVKQGGERKFVWLRGNLQDKRGKGNLLFMVLRQQWRTIQVVIDANSFITTTNSDDPTAQESDLCKTPLTTCNRLSCPPPFSGSSISSCPYSVPLLIPADRKTLIKWASAIPIESVIEIFGEVVVPKVPVTSTTQPLELLCVKVFAVSKALQELPFQLKDASRKEEEDEEQAKREDTEKAVGGEGKGKKEGDEEDSGLAVSVLQDVRLDNRVLDLRTPANNGIVKVRSRVCKLFREFLGQMHNFDEVQTPKLIGGSSEGGANVFSLKYFGQDATLAQSPQLYKQMLIVAGFDKVFEIGPVFRAENSNTHRHLCEFTGLDMEMSFKDDFMEVVEFIVKLFLHIFAGLREECKREIEAISTQFPHEPFKWLPAEQTPIIPFVEGVRLLRDEGGVKDIPEDLSNYDLTTEHEKLLGRLVKQKYHTDFFVVTHFPLNIRAFYSMPSSPSSSSGKLRVCNSYDFYMRGEEILSGAERIIEPKLLTERAKAAGIDPTTLQFYIDSFRLGCPPHAGCGVGLDRVVMLFLALGNIRKVALFPRDPKRLTP